LRIIELREEQYIGHKAGMRQAGITYKILVGRPGIKHPLGRPKSRKQSKAVGPDCEYRCFN
jgi:hypothetical protein